MSWMTGRLALLLVALLLVGASWLIFEGQPAQAPLGEGAGAGEPSAAPTDPSLESSSDETKPELGTSAAVHREEMPAPGTFHSATELDGLIGSFRGRLIDEAGNPIADVTTRGLAILSPPLRWDESRNLLPPDWGARSNNDGQFLLPAPDRDDLSYFLEFTHPELAPMRLERLRCTPGRTRELGDLVMEVGFHLSGQVVDPNGTPIAGATVTPHPSSDESSFNPSSEPDRALLPSQVTDAQGAFHFAHLPTRSLRCRAEHPDFFQAWSAPAQGESGEEKEGLTIHLATAMQLHGTVVDPNRRGIPDASVLVRDQRWEDGSTQSPFKLEVKTDEQGRFQLAAPEGMSRSSLAATAPGYYIHKVSLREDGLTAAIEIELTALPPVKGVVVDDNGAPVAGATVALIAQGTKMLDPRSAKANVTAVTDADGNFELTPDLGMDWKENFLAFAWHEDHATGRSSSLRLSARNAGKQEELRIVLSPAHIIEGTVLKPDGTPLPGARVDLRALKRPNRSRLGQVNEAPRGGEIVQVTSSEADGRFRFQNLAPADYRVEAHHAGWSPAESEDFPLQEEVHTVELRMAAASGIVGQVVGDLQAFPHLRVIASAPGHSRLDAYVDPGGGFRFEELLPGPWDLQLVDASDPESRDSFNFGGDALATAEDIEVVEGQDAAVQLHLDLSGLGMVHGQVLINGQQRSDYRVFAVPKMGNGSDPAGVQRRNIMRGTRSTTTDFEGRYRIHGIQPDDYWLLLVQPNGRPSMMFDPEGSSPKGMERKSITIREGSQLTHDFNHYRGELKVVVSNPKGSASTTIRLEPMQEEGLMTYNARLSRKGHLFPGISAGSYRLRVRMGREWMDYPVTVSGVSQTEVVVALPTKEAERSNAKEKPRSPR